MRPELEDVMSTNDHPSTGQPKYANWRARRIAELSGLLSRYLDDHNRAARAASTTRCACDLCEETRHHVYRWLREDQAEEEKLRAVREKIKLKEIDRNMGN
jgi:hypothetical protein